MDVSFFVLHRPLSKEPHPSWGLERPDEDAGWLLTFSDLVLLLFCFFVLGYVAQRTSTSRSLGFPKAGTPPVPKVSSSKKEEASLLKPPLLMAGTVLPPAAQEDRGGEGSGEARGALTSGRWEVLKEEVQEHLAKAGLAEGVSVVSTQHELLITLKDRVPFALGRADLRREVLPVLQKVAALA